MALLSVKPDTARSIEIGNISMNLNTFEVSVGEQLVDMSYQEFELLRLLMLQPNKILPHSEITLCLWSASGKQYLRRLAVLIHRVRAKLASSQPYALKGARGRGYGLIAVRLPSERGAAVPEG